MAEPLVDRTKASTPSFNVEIHMAGDIAMAGEFIQEFVDRKGLCVALTSQSFIYTGGREEGFKAGLINYPRFPKEPDEILMIARELAAHLRVMLDQSSYSIVTPIETIWISYRIDDTTPPTPRAERSALADQEGGT